MARLNQAEFMDKRFEDSDPDIKEINSGKFDKDVIRDLFDVLVKYGYSHNLSTNLLFRTAYLIRKQQDSMVIMPLQLEPKAK